MTNSATIATSTNLKEVTAGLWAYHDKPERWIGLQDIHHQLSDHDFYRLFVQVWIDNECNDAYLTTIDDLIDQRNIKASTVIPALNAKEQAFYRDLPDNVPVFRGTTLENPWCDYSWTTSREKAEWFALRCDQATPAIATGLVSKDAMLFACNQRNESEIAVRTQDVNGIELEQFAPYRIDDRYRLYSLVQSQSDFNESLVRMRIEHANAFGMTPAAARQFLIEQVEDAERLGFRTIPTRRRSLIEGVDLPDAQKSDPI